MNAFNDLDFLQAHFTTLTFRTMVRSADTLSIYNWPLDEHPEPVVPLLEFYTKGNPRIAGEFHGVAHAVCLATEARIRYAQIQYEKRKGG
jgi:hypothetical protein